MIWFWYGNGSIANKNTKSLGDEHPWLPAILMFTRGTGFDPSLYGVEPLTCDPGLAPRWVTCWPKWNTWNVSGSPWQPWQPVAIESCCGGWDKCPCWCRKEVGKLIDQWFESAIETKHSEKWTCFTLRIFYRPTILMKSLCRHNTVAIFGRKTASYFFRKKYLSLTLTGFCVPKRVGYGHPFSSLRASQEFVLFGRGCLSHDIPNATVDFSCTS